MIDYMPSKNASETIEILSRKLERVRILNDLKSCTNIELSTLHPVRIYRRKNFITLFRNRALFYFDDLSIL